MYLKTRFKPMEKYMQQIVTIVYTGLISKNVKTKQIIPIDDVMG